MTTVELVSKFNLLEIHGPCKIFYGVVHISSEGKTVSSRVARVVHLRYRVMRQQLDGHQQGRGRTEPVIGHFFRSKDGDM